MDKAFSHLQVTCIYIGTLNRKYCFEINFNYFWSINISYKLYIKLAIPFYRASEKAYYKELVQPAQSGA